MDPISKLYLSKILKGYSYGCINHIQNLKISSIFMRQRLLSLDIIIRVNYPFKYDYLYVQDCSNDHEEVLSWQPGGEAGLPEGRDNGHQEAQMVPGTQLINQGWQPKYQPNPPPKKKTYKKHPKLVLLCVFFLFQGNSSILYLLPSFL